MVNYGGTDVYDEGTEDFDYPARLADDTFAFRGRWTLDYQGATAESDKSASRLTTTRRTSTSWSAARAP